MEKEFSCVIRRSTLIFKDGVFEKEFYLFKESCNPLSKLVKKIGLILCVIITLAYTGSSFFFSEWKKRLIICSVIISSQILHFLTYRIKKFQNFKGSILVLSLGICYCENSILLNSDLSQGIYYGTA